jgi:hypothetical protein
VFVVEFAIWKELRKVLYIVYTEAVAAKVEAIYKAAAEAYYA